MPIDNVLASVAVKDVKAAAGWYARLLGTAGTLVLPTACSPCAQSASLREVVRFFAAAFLPGALLLEAPSDGDVAAAS
jgi:hypothetical protein